MLHMYMYGIPRKLNLDLFVYNKYGTMRTEWTHSLCRRLSSRNCWYRWRNSRKSSWPKSRAGTLRASCPSWGGVSQILISLNLVQPFLWFVPKPILLNQWVLCFIRNRIRGAKEKCQALGSAFFRPHGLEHTPPTFFRSDNISIIAW